jgi:hypothetical protein
MHSKREGKLLRDDLTIAHNDNIRLKLLLTQKLVTVKKNTKGLEPVLEIIKKSKDPEGIKVADQETVNKLIQSIKIIENNQPLINVIHNNNKMNYQDKTTKLQSVEENYKSYDSDSVKDKECDTKELEQMALEELRRKLREKETMVEGRIGDCAKDKEVQVKVKTQEKANFIEKKLLGIKANDVSVEFEKILSNQESQLNSPGLENSSQECESSGHESKKNRLRQMKSVSLINLDEVQGVLNMNSESTLFGPFYAERLSQEVRKITERLEGANERLKNENEWLKIEIYEKNLEKAQLKMELLEDERIIEEMMNPNQISQSNEVENHTKDNGEQKKQVLQPKKQLYFKGRPPAKGPA